MRAEAAIGHTIRKIRKQKGWFSVDLAYQIPIAKGYLSEIEHGHKAPSIAMLNDIARALQMKPSDFWRAVAESIDEL
jgi:transcriptional regulator with XRE-family HTH domain